jgi:CDP-glycerol glycerophosphotransferase
MVLLEALVLGLPVISASFASVADAFPDGCGLVVESTEKALAQGMIAFLKGDVKFEPFDYVAYNRDATNEFYRAIGAAPVNA